MAIFPGSVATDTDLFIAVNDQATALTGSLTSGTTSIPVTSTTGFPASGYLSIDSEIMHYSAIADSTHFTVDVRGADGTSAAAHSSVTAVYHNVIAAHHNVLKDEIKAIESMLNAKLGTSGSAYTNNRAVATNASGVLVVATTTDTELGYLSGVTSAIQTQLGLKAPLASPTFTGTVVVPTPFTVGAVSVTATGTELNYVVGVTSAIQTQLAARLPLAGGTMSGSIVLPDGAKNGPALKFADVGFYRKTTDTLSISFDNTTEYYSFGPGSFIMYSDALATIAWSLQGGTSTINSGVVNYTGNFRFLSQTATTVPYLDSNKGLTSSSVTPTELGYLSGVTSAIQTQLGLKAPLASPTFTGVVTLAAGSAGAPALTFGDSTTGFYRSGANQVGCAISGVAAWRTLSGGTSDDALYQTIEMFGGGAAGISRYSTTSVTTAKTIYPAGSDYDYAAVQVIGSDGSGNEFMEWVTTNGATVSAAYGSLTKGSPAARTYSCSSTNLRVAMASGTYTINVVAYGANKR